ncbi:MAG TPA: hypothetical protein VKD70_01115 [Candidatus Acidoferrum sp.]|nr:hypothetical protein [Candidatus Acidoferrum sp.]
MARTSKRIALSLTWRASEEALCSAGRGVQFFQATPSSGTAEKTGAGDFTLR